MATYPTLWQHGKCMMFFSVDAEKGTNFKTVNGLVNLWCPHCKEWTEPGANNGRSFREGA